MSNTRTDAGFSILSVNLSDGKSKTQIVEEELVRAYYGGASLAARLLLPHLTESLDPMSPEAPLLFLTGPLTGTVGPAVGRFVVCGKSPATGLWAESNIGGFFGPELRAAGYDGLFITGRADKAVYLFVNETELQIRSAGHIWGLDPYRTQDTIKADHQDPGIKVASIGRAGEQRIPFSVILCDHGRVAGRTGLGAVMGAKNLKAVAVRGELPIPLANETEFNALRAKINRSLRTDIVSVGLRDYGTGSGSDIFDYFGMMPKNYFSRGHLPGVEKISGTTMNETILTGVSACHGCVIACGRKVTLSDQVERKGPEYETTMGFGPNLGITELEVTTRLGDLCDQYGMDTISLSNTIGLAFLLFERGNLSTAHTGGVELTWGDELVVEQLIHQTIDQEDLGAYIARGARSLAQEFGADELAAQVHGLEIPYHDPRGASGMALVYVTSPRGACHNQSYYYMVEMGQTMEEIGVDLIGRTQSGGKAANVARHQDWTTVANALVLCIFSNVPPSTICALFNLAIGSNLDPAEFLLGGERGWNIKRLLNIRLGLDRSKERLPAHLMKPLTDGNAAGITPPLQELLGSYYQHRGWDPISGSPNPSKLSELGLDELSMIEVPVI